MALLNLSGTRKLPMLRQAEAAECGLACVCMVASAHGYETDLPTIRRRFPISLKGSTLQDIVDIASQLDLGSRALRCEPSDLQELRVPAILHWNMNHFVVLKRANRNWIEIHDPASGLVKLSLGDVGKHFTGVALELTPSPTFKKARETNPVKLFSLFNLDNSAWSALAQGLALSLFLQVFVLLSPYYMQLVIDEAILKGDLSLLTVIAIGFAVLIVFEAFTTVLRGLVFQFVSSTVGYDMQANLFRHMIRLPLPFFHRRHIGDIQQGFLSLTPVQQFIANGAIAGLIDGLLGILLGVVLFLYNAMLGLAVCGFILAYAALRFAFLSFSKRLSAELLIADAKEQTKFLETLRAMQTIKVAGIESPREAQWRNLAAHTVNAQIRVGNLDIGYRAVSQTLMGASNIFVVYLAATNAIGGTMTIGMITAFIAYKSQFEQRMMGLLEQFMQFKMLEVHLERVSDIALQPKESGLAATDQNRSLAGSVTLDNIFYRYGPFEPDILKGASLDILPGEFIALAAPSGAGKSTLLRLLVGLYEPTSGRVLFDGIEVSRLGLSLIRRQVGVVMQDDKLLAGSIEDNISLFDERPDHGRVRWAAEIAAVHDEIEGMPMGYRSLVGDMGTTLSGGQQQRVLLARALYRRPNILIMDEGTSALDIATERRVNLALRKLKITRIVAAHRPETLAMADRVIGLQDGRLSPVRIDLSINSESSPDG